MKRYKHFEKNIKQLLLRGQLDVKKVLIQSNNYFNATYSNTLIGCGWVQEFEDVAGKFVTINRYLHSPNDEKYFKISNVEDISAYLMDTYTQYTYSSDMIDFAYFKYCPEYAHLWNTDLKRFDNMSDAELKQYITDLKTTLK